jgi:hypothetical protein
MVRLKILAIALLLPAFAALAETAPKLSFVKQLSWDRLWIVAPPAHAPKAGYFLDVPKYVTAVKWHETYYSFYWHTGHLRPETPSRFAAEICKQQGLKIAGLNLEHKPRPKRPKAVFTCR